MDSNSNMNINMGMGVNAQNDPSKVNVQMGMPGMIGLNINAQVHNQPYPQ